MSEIQSITSYLTHIKYLKEQSIAIDKSIAQKEIIIVTIKGLPTSYQIFIIKITIAGRLATIGFKELNEMFSHHELQAHSK